MASRRLANRARALANNFGAAAPLWESVNALAARPGMINMGQGFPDFEGSSVARRAAAEAIEAGAAVSNQYSPQPGLFALREAVSDFVSRRYSTTVDAATEVVVTAGAQEALAASFLSFLDPGDEVIVFEPFYPFMLGAIAQAGPVPRCVTLRSEDGFAIDAAALEAAASSPRARMLVLNSPHNPTGHVASAEELRLVADACMKHDLLAISDEVYEACIFPTDAAVDARHLRLADQPGMAERTVTLGSGGKLFALTGWRVAWAYGPAELVQPIGRAHTHLTFSAPTPLQLGVAAALRCDDGLDSVGPTFGANHARLAAALEAAVPSVRRVCPAGGGYFLVAQTDGRSDVAFCADLAESKGVVCTPMSVFYSTPFADDAPCELVRFTVCKSEAYMQRACAALLN